MSDKLVPEIQLTHKFYNDQLGLLLKKSKTLPQQIRAYVTLLEEINNVSADLLDGLNILNVENPNSDILTKIGRIVGGPREFLYNGKSYVMNDEQYLAYIYAHIIQNNWDGTLKQANELYEKLHKLNEQVNVKIIPTGNPLEIYLMMDLDSLLEEDKDNYEAMFNSGYFDLVSMGVSFKREIQSFKYNGYWDSVSNQVINVIYKNGVAEVDGTTKEQFIQNHGYWDVARWN